VQDVINSSKKSNDDWGLQGYSIPKYNAHLDKPPKIQIQKNKIATFLEQVQKEKGYIPGPVYNVSGSMVLNKKISISKLPKVTFAQELMKKSEKTPSPG
jgi:hypothetical protein